MKLMKFFGVALVATLLGAGFCACSDDDDNGGLSSPTDDVSVITTDGGELLLLNSIKAGSSNYLRFYYDEIGRCTDVYLYSSQLFGLSYNPFKITSRDEDETISLSFNNKGYVTKENCSSSWEDGNDSGNFTYTSNYSYDSDGHLIKSSGKTNETYFEDGQRYTYIMEYTATLTWENGDLIKMIHSETEIEDGISDGVDEEVFEYTYDNAKNEYQQFTVALSGAYSSFYVEDGLVFLGYYGKGTSHLPTYVINSNGSSITYTINSDGTINTERVASLRTSTTYTYSYTSLDSDTRSAVPTFEDAFATPWNDNNVERKRMFGRHSQRHSKYKTAE